MSDTISGVESAPNQASYPRIDRVIERLQYLRDGTYRETGEVSVLTGTPTQGATLENLHGCPAEPVGHRTNGMILVPGVSLDRH